MLRLRRLLAWRTLGQLIQIVHTAHVEAFGQISVRVLDSIGLQKLLHIARCSPPCCTSSLLRQRRLLTHVRLESGVHGAVVAQII